LVALIDGSFAGVTELIMFNRPAGPGGGQLLRRVNFAVPDNFPRLNGVASVDAPAGRLDPIETAEASYRNSTRVNVGWTWLFALNKR
jgi:hypothetical protein